ncbi:SatD family protein [Tessaracoccus sp. MC1756]|uniref:SatD family protein n=1 Tax=Tessaracoccus sp. MC1756 TaxID=2760311 RepID=UPI0015FF5F5A|nr:SatD family protein [Tessaracoccus sp. MC1756]MBB1508529.1 RNA polymerase subunit sigma-70 [Tessaracoccus sp. MC1756]
MKDWSNVVAVLFDVVGSRGESRAQRHRALLSAVDDTNRRVPPLDALRFTVGDELQGIYASVEEALRAAYILRLTLAPEVDLRVGIGVGEVKVIDEERGIQDGTAWWRAREAVDAVRAQASDAGYRGTRTAIVGVQPSLLHSTVGLIDAHLARLRGTTVGSLLGLLDGLSNAEIAEREAISESANSQRVINNDLRPLADAIRAVTGG